MLKTGQRDYKPTKRWPEKKVKTKENKSKYSSEFEKK